MFDAESDRRFDAVLDQRLMRIALRFARRGRPSPNPHVGAVIARGREIIAVGHHERAGEGHAEIVALRCAGERARGATLYVTLEPCNHHGRTPPCTDAIITAGIARVVFGSRDPAPHVAGSSARLAAASISVDGPVCELEATRLVADFAKHFTTGLPFVTLTGRLSAMHRLEAAGVHVARSLAAPARRRWLRERTQSDAVLVSTPDGIAPALHGSAISVTGSALADLALNTAPDQRKSPVFVPFETALSASEFELRAMLSELGRRDVVRLRIEADAPTCNALLRAGLVDRVSLILTSAPNPLEISSILHNFTPMAVGFHLVDPRVFERDGDVWLDADVESRSRLVSNLATEHI